MIIDADKLQLPYIITHIRNCDLLHIIAKCNSICLRKIYATSQSLTRSSIMLYFNFNY